MPGFHLKFPESFLKPMLEEWAGKEDGKKQSKMVVYVDTIEFLSSRGDNPAAGAEEAAPAAKKASKKTPVEAGGGEGQVPEVSHRVLHDGSGRRDRHRAHR